MDGYYTQDGQQGLAQIIPDSSQMYMGEYGPEDGADQGYGYFLDDGTTGGADNDGDSKRRRIARACDMCRKKKIKCDGGMPACKNCINYKTECIFTQVEKKRNPPKGAKYIEGLENRLGRMESLLKLSGLLGAEDEGTDLGTLEKKLADKAALSGRLRSETPTKSPGRSDSASQAADRHGSPAAGSGAGRDRQPPAQDSSRAGSPAADGKTDDQVEALSDMMCSLVTNNLGESRYIGSSSGFSIFSPKGIQWVNDKTGDESFLQVMQHTAEDHGKMTYWRPDIFSDIFGRRQYRPLPPIGEALSLCRDYFDNFNCMFPLFHEPTFMHLLRRQNSHEPYEGTGWWASLNVVLAIAHRLREMSNVSSPDEEGRAWGFLKNALGVWPDLTLKNTDLLSVQALIGMALFLQGTPSPQPPFFLVGAAIRLAHSIGLHKRGAAFGLNPIESEQRKRVFWIAYILDKDMCLRSGRPPAQDDDDMNIDLPSEDPPDNIGNVPNADGLGKTNIFRFMCTFSTIQSRVYKRLYSTRAGKQSDGELLNVIGELDRELEEWKDSMPPEFRPDNDIKATHRPLILHLAVLHFAYYNCLTTVHRMSVHNGFWTSRLSNYAVQGLNARPLNPRVFNSAAICMQAARSSVHLCRYIPQGDFACVWMILYYPVSAAVTLFANILQTPEDPRARSDLRLMHQVCSFLSTSSADEETGYVKRVLTLTTEFERIARIVLEKVDKENAGRRKKKASLSSTGIKDEHQHRSTKAGSPLSDGTAHAHAHARAERKAEKRARQASPARSGRATTPASTGPPPSSSSATAFNGNGNGSVNSGFDEASLQTTTSSFNSPLNGYARSTQSMASDLSHSSGPDFSRGPQLPQLQDQRLPLDSDGFSTAFAPFDGMAQPAPFADPLADPLADALADPMTGIDLPGQAFGGPQAFMPQDVWQMPMTLEWDWAGMTPGGDGFGPGIDGGEMAGQGPGHQSVLHQQGPM